MLALQVQARMQDLKERLFSHVAAVLEATEDSPAAVRVRSGRWKGVWDKAMRFFKRDSVTHSDGEAADIHNADLQATLEELHNDIQEQISAEVRLPVGRMRLEQTDVGVHPAQLQFRCLEGRHYAWQADQDWCAAGTCFSDCGLRNELQVCGSIAAAAALSCPLDHLSPKFCLCLCSAIHFVQVAEFWHEVELALNVRQQSMFRAVNAHLERLSRAVEDVVGGLLSLRLEPVVVRMEAPSATEFHTSLQQLFTAGALSPLLISLNVLPCSAVKAVKYIRLFLKSL